MKDIDTRSIYGENRKCMRKRVLGKLRSISEDTIKTTLRKFGYENVVKKSSPSTRHGGAWGERRYSSYSFTTSALDGGEWSASRPGRALVSGKGPPVSIVQEAGWAPEPVWTQRLEEKSFAPCRPSVKKNNAFII
jgi:hypothetical protein